MQYLRYLNNIYLREIEKGVTDRTTKFPKWMRARYGSDEMCSDFCGFFDVKEYAKGIKILTGTEI